MNSLWALQAIALGVHNSQEAENLKGTGAKINPRYIFYNNATQQHELGGLSTSPRVEIIEFDILISAEADKSTSSGGEGGVNIQVIKSNLNTDWSSSKSNATASRMKFSIPILLLFENIWWNMQISISAIKIRVKKSNDD